MKTCAVAAALLCASQQALAQQAHVNLDWNPHKNVQNLNPYGANVISPEVRDDRTVTFRLKAPDARTVALTGAPMLLAVGKGNTPLPFKKGADGTWTLTVGPIKPNLYVYKFLIDGVAVVDPNNTLTGFGNQPGYSTLVVHGDGPAYYDARPVPHGSDHATRLSLEGARRRARALRLHATGLRPQPTLSGAVPARWQRRNRIDAGGSTAAPASLPTTSLRKAARCR